MATVNIPKPRLDFREHPFWSSVAAYLLIGWLLSYPIETELLHTRCGNYWHGLNSYGAACADAPGWIIRTLEIVLWPVGAVAMMPWTFAASFAAILALFLFSARAAASSACDDARWQEKRAKRQQDEAARLERQLDAAEKRARNAEIDCAEAEDARDAVLAQLRALQAQLAGAGGSRYEPDEDGPSAGL